MICLLASFSHHHGPEYGCSKRKGQIEVSLISEHCIQPDVKKPNCLRQKKAPLKFMPSVTFVVVVKMGTGEIAYYSWWNP